MRWAALGAWYVVLQLVALLILPALSSWVFGLWAQVFTRLGQ